MSLRSIKIKIIFYGICLVFLFPRPVHAYLDPGTGSYLFQLFIGGLLGGSFFLKGAFKKIKGFFKRKSSGKAAKKSDEEG